MLDVKKDVKRVKRLGSALDGVTKRRMGEFLIIEVDIRKAKFKGKSYAKLDLLERQHYDDLLYISNVQIGNPIIRYV